jgi:hypothetical protein
MDGLVTPEHVLSFLTENANSGAFIVGAVTTLIALIALLFARHQIRISREIDALNAYEKLHHLCLQYPKFAVGYSIEAEQDASELSQYFTFVMSTLLTIERILVLFPKDQAWRAAFVDDLKRHENFLGSEKFRPYRASLSPKLLALIDRHLEGRSP